MQRSRVSAVTALSAIALTMTALTAAPAQAAPVGSGRALVHIDADQVTATSTGANSYDLAFPAGTSGQWMGERKNAAGKTKVRIGTLTGAQLVDGWKSFKYTSSGANSTLVWNSSNKKPDTAFGKLTAPTVAADGTVHFTFTTAVALPTALNDSSLNLGRAVGKSVRGTSANAQTPISNDFYVNASVAGNTTVIADYMDDRSGSVCTEVQTKKATTVSSVPGVTCGSIGVLSGGSQASTWATSSVQGQLFVSLSLTASGSNTTFPYQGAVLFWSSK